MLENDHRASDYLGIQISDSIVVKSTNLESKTVTPFTLTLGNIFDLSVPLSLSVKGQKTRSYDTVL